jgi:hypothetical protein
MQILAPLPEWKVFSLKGKNAYFIAENGNIQNLQTYLARHYQLLS